MKESEKQNEIEKTETTTEITHSSKLANFLSINEISIAFTSYQSGGLYLLGSDSNHSLTLHEARYPQAMGVTGDANRIYLATLTQIVRLENVLGPDQRANDQHDKLYVPRNAQTIGAVDMHEVGVARDGRVIFVCTQYSCLAQPSLTHSFKPIWKPPFISALRPEDRCHLNGLAMVDGEPRFASAVCRSDIVDGWRDRRHDGGILIDVQTDEIIAEGLSMPHSPRVYQDRLWMLNSGSGELGWINRDSRQFQPLSFHPGFLRGLAFWQDYAILTLSKPRYGRFEGLALDDGLKNHDADAWCGVQVVSLKDGGVVHWLRFDGAIAELFDVCVLPGVRNALTIGPDSSEIRELITVESPAWQS